MSARGYRHRRHLNTPHAIVKWLGGQFSLLRISCVADINTMLIKSPTHSFTCPFRFAGCFKQPWGAAITAAHSENMFVKIKSQVVFMSEKKKPLRKPPSPPSTLLKPFFLFPLYSHFHHSAHNSVSGHRHKAQRGVMQVISPLFIWLHCLLHSL